MIRRRRRTHGLRHLFEAELGGGGSSQGGGESSIVTPPATPEAPDTQGQSGDDSQGAKAPDTSQSKERPSLAEIINKQLGDAAPSIKENKEPKLETEPEGDKKPDGEKLDAQKPDDAPPAKEGEEADKDTDGKEGEKPERLSDEEIDTKFANSNKGARNYIKAQAAIIRQLDEFGGPKALKTVSAIAESITGTDNAAAKTLQQEIRAHNPVLLNELQSDIFNGALDERPDLIDSFIKSQLGDGFDGETLLAIAGAVKRGEIDLDEIKGAHKEQDPQAQITALQKEVETLKTGQGQAKETDGSEFSTEYITREVAALGKQYDSAVIPILQEMGVYPHKDDPQPIQAMKSKLFEFIRGDLTQFCSTHQNWKSLDQLVRAGALNAQTARSVDGVEKGAVWEWQLDRAMTAAKAYAKEQKLIWQPIIFAALKNYNASPAAKNKERPPQPQDEITGTKKSATVEVPDIPLGEMTDEQRQARMAAAVLKVTGGNGARASA